MIICHRILSIYIRSLLFIHSKCNTTFFCLILRWHYYYIQKKFAYIREIEET